MNIHRHRLLCTQCNTPIGYDYCECTDDTNHTSPIGEMCQKCRAMKKPSPPIAIAGSIVLYDRWCKLHEKS